MSMLESKGTPGLPNDLRITVPDVGDDVYGGGHPESAIPRWRVIAPPIAMMAIRTETEFAVHPAGTEFAPLVPAGGAEASDRLG